MEWTKGVKTVPPLTKPGKVTNVMRPAAVEDVLALIRKNVEVKDAYIRLLLLGDPGVGKTALAATAENALLIVTEGSVSLGTLGYMQEQLGRPIEYALVSSASEVDGLLLYLENQARQGAFPYDTVVIDSLSRYCELAGNDLAGGETILSLSDLDEDRNFRFWQALLEHMRQFLNRLQQLPAHVICTSHVREDRKTLYPAVYPKQLRTRIAGDFNLVGYMDRASGLLDDVVDDRVPERVLYFDRAGVVTKNAGVRKMPPKLVNPTFGDILRIWNGEDEA